MVAAPCDVESVLLMEQCVQRPWVRFSYCRLILPPYLSLDMGNTSLNEKGYLFH